jgi:tRNA(Met) C34 N-acetyltransferase TmcA
MGHKKELSKDSKYVQAWRGKAVIVKRETVSSKEQTFQNFLKNLDYTTDTSNVHRFISTLNKCDINNSECVNFKNSTEYKDKEIAKSFPSLYTSADHIPKYLKKEEKHMKHTMKQKCRTTDQENIFNSDFRLHNLTQAIASLKTRKSPGPDSIMAEFLKYVGPVALGTFLQLFN